MTNKNKIGVSHFFCYFDFRFIRHCEHFSNIYLLMYFEIIRLLHKCCAFDLLLFVCISFVFPIVLHRVCLFVFFFYFVEVLARLNYKIREWIGTAIIHATHSHIVSLIRKYSNVFRLRCKCLPFFYVCSTRLFALPLFPSLPLSHTYTDTSTDRVRHTLDVLKVLCFF